MIHSRHFFRFDLPVTNSPDNYPPDCDLVIESEIDALCGVHVTFDATGSTDPENDPITFEWDFDGDDVFGDSYDGDPDNPTHIYYSNYTGNACIRVSDDNGGNSICCVSVDISVDALTKNIDVTNPLGEAMDMCIDHITGDVLVLYDNGNVRNYHANDCYTTFDTYFVPPDCTKIDMASNGYFLTGYSIPWDTIGWGGHFYYNHYNHDGVMVKSNGNGWHQGTYYIKDVFTMGPNGTLANDHGFIWNLITGDGPPFGSHIWANRDEDNFADGTYWRVLSYYYTWPVPGIDKVYAPWVVGVETDRDADCMWIVENTECVAVRFDISDHTYDFQGTVFRRT